MTLAGTPNFCRDAPFARFHGCRPALETRQYASAQIAAHCPAVAKPPFVPSAHVHVIRPNPRPDRQQLGVYRAAGGDLGQHIHGCRGRLAGLRAADRGLRTHVAGCRCTIDPAGHHAPPMARCDAAPCQIPRLHRRAEHCPALCPAVVGAAICALCLCRNLDGGAAAVRASAGPHLQ
jgi:hypothetical protein